MAPIMGRLQRVLRTIRPHCASHRNHSANLDPFLRRLRAIYALVAETNGQLVGLAHYLFHRSTITISPTCYLQDLFTSQPARGKGVGKALIKGVYEQAKNTGSSRVYWHTHETNKTARRLYDQVAENAGFIVYRNHAWTQQPEPQMHADLRT